MEHVLVDRPCGRECITVSAEKVCVGSGESVSSSAAEPERTSTSAPAAESDSEDDDDEDEAGAVVASHPLLGVAPPARKRRRAAVGER